MCTFGAAIATGLSVVLESEAGYNRIILFLLEQDYTSKDLWQQIKVAVNKVEREDCVLIIGDTI